MKSNVKLITVLFILALSLFTNLSLEAKALKVVTTLPDYAYLASKIGGEFVDVKAIVSAGQDAHFIRPKPSIVEMLRNADLLIATGLDLEMWLPSAVDKSGNRKIRSGEVGYVSAATGMNLKDKPVALSHIEGGLHLYGNPHVTVSALNIIQAIDNIRIGLSRNQSEHAQVFTDNANALTNDISKKLYGEELINMLGQKTLLDLHRAGKLINFLNEKKFKGRPLAESVGGWLGKLWSLRGTRIVSYHKNWLYFFDDFGLLEGGYIEPKPGIPPSPRHLSGLKESMKQQNCKIVISTDYFDEKTVRQVAADTGAVYVMLPYYVGGRPGIDSWIKLMDFWVEQIAGAAQKAGAQGGVPDGQ
ncbi:MAG: metal ABC transporter substrate-binding protein [Candidatus Riflebacteria bacterium]|nr:metal ABC transporter substrate-binding protein [Candidatus Riflebacteria bacterium]